ncbi:MULTISPECIES: carbohydrate ABC transporter permease [Eisenbergiella]|uniref:Sugar ABC transporter permease n=1 Tax=Eisenbergiella porci TaxID=2652274 RepID=A0A6N7VXW9_9FIRM|nr:MULTISPECIES: sugar ABC transporter permease [Eisenbergiella]MDY2654825.1 sugar ABC transporter permease [Eisenbergiella porci]MSS87102.1 sugar ABC transporter permease [Eisenbergiella porci]
MKSKKRKLNQRTVFIIAFLLPSVLLFAIIYAYPLVNIFLTSFCEWNSKNFVSPKFLGWDHMFDNYIKMFTLDANFKMALLNSLKWVVLTLLIQVPWSVLVALVLSSKERGWRFIRNMFVIPNIISTAAIGLIFLNLYSPSRGIITEICNMIVPESNVSVLANEKWAFWGVTFSFILFGGSSCLLLLTQIFSIDPGVYEAAKIDGASSFQIALKIKLPLMKPMIGTISVIAANYGLLLYNEIALISGGGPDNATYSLSYYIYKTAMGSTKLNFARGNAAGVVQIILGVVLVGLLNKVLRTQSKEDMM